MTVQPCNAWDGPTDSDGEPCIYINHYHCDAIEPFESEDLS